MFISISKGYMVEIDDEDAPIITGNKWTARVNSKTDYTVRVYAYRQQTQGGRIKQIYMHRLLANAPPGMDVDHIDGNTLNNRKSNLRLCTRSQNLSNTKRHADKTHDLPKGIEYRGNRTNKYSARICHNGVRYCLGSFYTIEEASEAYNKKALELFKEFVKT